MYPILAMLQKMSDANSSFGETVGNELWRQCWRGDAAAVRKALRGGTDVNEVGNLFLCSECCPIYDLSVGWEG